MENPSHIEVCKNGDQALCLHTNVPLDTRPLTARHLVRLIPLKWPPPPLVAMLGVPMLKRKTVRALQGIPTKHGQPKWPNVLQHAINVALKADKKPRCSANGALTAEILRHSGTIQGFEALVCTKEDLEEVPHPSDGLGLG